MTRTGAPAIVWPASAACAVLAARVLLPNDSLSGGGKARTNVVRPSAETNARLPVEANDAVRSPGMARCRRRWTFSRPARTVGELTDVPAGSVTTGISGEVRPPWWKRRWICELVS